MSQILLDFEIFIDFRPQKWSQNRPQFAPRKWPVFALLNSTRFSNFYWFLTSKMEPESAQISTLGRGFLGSGPLRGPLGWPSRFWVVFRPQNGPNMDPRGPKCSQNRFKMDSNMSQNLQKISASVTLTKVYEHSKMDFEQEIGKLNLKRNVDDAFRTWT